MKWLIGLAIPFGLWAQTDAALRTFTLAVKNAPADPRAHLLLGTALLDRAAHHPEHLFSALRELRRAAELAPEEPEYTYQLGRAYQRAAEWSVEQLRVNGPDSARLYLSLGESYLAEHKPEAAMEALRKAAAAGPQMAGVHLAMAFVLAQDGKREAALAELERELAVAPGSAAAETMKQQLTSR